MPGPTALKSRSNLSLLFENDVASTKGQITADGEFEKDEAERRLEKLLFGDEAGFLEALQQRTYGQSLARVHDNDSQHENAEDGLDQVADEDVCTFFEARRLLTRLALLLRFWNRQCTTNLLRFSPG